MGKRRNPSYRGWSAQREKILSLFSPYSFYFLSSLVWLYFGGQEREKRRGGSIIFPCLEVNVTPRLPADWEVLIRTSGQVWTKGDIQQYVFFKRKERKRETSCRAFLKGGAADVDFFGMIQAPPTLYHFGWAEGRRNQHSDQLWPSSLSSLRARNLTSSPVGMARLLERIGAPDRNRLEVECLYFSRHNLAPLLGSSKRGTPFFCCCWK